MVPIRESIAFSGNTGLCLLWDKTATNGKELLNYLGESRRASKWGLHCRAFPAVQIKYAGTRSNF